MNVTSAKDVGREKLGTLTDAHGRKFQVSAVWVEVSATFDDGTEKTATQRVINASIDSPELTMSLEVAQTQDDWQAQILRVLNAHAPATRVESE